MGVIDDLEKSGFGKSLTGVELRENGGENSDTVSLDSAFNEFCCKEKK